MSKFYTVCLFGAASEMIDDNYKNQIEELGKMLAKNGCSLVYGAGATGCMGAIARGVDVEKGFVFGVTTNFMETFEKVYDCDKLIKTRTLNERKTIMEEHADFFIVAPGGIGTMDELFEILTLKYLKQTDKPIILYNIDGFFNDVVVLIEKLVEKKFAGEKVLELFEVCNTIDEIKERLLKEKDKNYGILKV